MKKPTRKPGRPTAKREAATEKIDVRATPRDKTTLKRAATVARKPLGTWLVGVGLEAAKKQGKVKLAAPTPPGVRPGSQAARMLERIAAEPDRDFGRHDFGDLGIAPADATTLLARLYRRQLVERMEAGRFRAKPKRKK